MYSSYTILRHMGLKKTKEQPRGSLWRTRSVISRETVLAVHELKRNRDNPKDLARVFETSISRLLKMDLLAVLTELQRQNQMFLSLKVFDFVRKESWYKPDQFFYRSMMDALGRNRLIHELERKFQELQDEGIKPEVPIYRELVGAYVRVGMMPEALEVHKKMVENGCGNDELSMKFLEMGRTKEAHKLKQKMKAEAKLRADELKGKQQRTDELQTEQLRGDELDTEQLRSDVLEAEQPRADKLKEQLRAEELNARELTMEELKDEELKEQVTNQ